MEKCNSCHGTGKWEEDPCPDCMGSGYEIPDGFILDKIRYNQKECKKGDVLIINGTKVTLLEGFQHFIFDSISIYHARCENHEELDCVTIDEDGEWFLGRSWEADYDISVLLNFAEEHEIHY
jgi:hypothetical protein